MLHRLLSDRRVRFLIAGGSAALLNWLVRFPLSIVLPYSAAVLGALGVGMTYGFLIYRYWAFQSPRTRPILVEIRDFLFVNALGAGLTLVVTLLVKMALSPPLSVVMGEAVAHAVGIAVAAVANYIGHKSITFRH